MKKMKRLSALLVCFCMLFTLLPQAALAADGALVTRVTAEDGTVMHGVKNIYNRELSDNTNANITYDEAADTLSIASLSDSNTTLYAATKFLGANRTDKVYVEFDMEVSATVSFGVMFGNGTSSGGTASGRRTIITNQSYSSGASHHFVVALDFGNGTAQGWVDGVDTTNSAASGFSELTGNCGIIFYTSNVKGTRTITISNLSFYSPADATTFQGGVVSGTSGTDARVAFNRPLDTATTTATIDGTAVTLTKVAESETAINEYVVDTTGLEEGTYTVQINAASIDGATTTVTYTIDNTEEVPFVSRLKKSDGTVIYGAENVIGSESLAKTTAVKSGNSVVYTATDAATSTGANTNYARLFLQPFGIKDGVTVVEFDTESYRADDKAEYFYMYYGDKWSGGTRTQTYTGGILSLAKAHWTVIMTNSTDSEGATTVNFKIYEDGKEITVANNNLPVLSEGKLILYVDKFYYVAATETIEADASTATFSNLHVYRPASGDFAGMRQANGNVAFNLPLASYSVTVDGDAATMTKVEETDTAINEYTVDTSYLGSGTHTVEIKATAIDGQTTTLTYEIEGVYPAFEAEVTKAQGGADAIVSLTFDDGLYDTALFLNDRFRRLGLRGSTMLITSRIENDEYLGTLSEWQALYNEGYLEPESHSYSHYMLPTEEAAESNSKNEDGTINETKKQQLLDHNTPENYQRELVQSQEDILRLFNHTSVGFAPAYNTLSDGAYDVVMDTYWGVRSGSRGVQSLDPQIGNDRGQWHNLYMRSFVDAKNNVETLCNQIDMAVEQKGWYISLCHGVGDSGDITQENADTVFSHISDLVKEGKVWCTTFGDAIKYVRERQASTLQAESDGETVTLNLTRAMTTEDDLALDADVFDVPLTVKVILPEGWQAVSMTQNGASQTVNAVIKAGVSYAYLDIVPNSDTVTLTEASAVDNTSIGEITINGAAAGDSFSAGNLDAAVAISNQQGVRTAFLCAAQYSANNELQQMDIDICAVGRMDSRELTASLDIENAPGTTVKVMLFDMATLEPLADAVVLNGI